MMYFWKLLCIPGTPSRICRKLAKFPVWRTAATQGTSAQQNMDAEAAKQTEHEDVYDLGRHRNNLEAMINDESITVLREYQDGTATYREYKRLASKFNIDLPEPPLEQRMDSKQKGKFFYKQFDTVEKSLIDNKPKNMIGLYSAATVVEELREVLQRSTEINKNILELSTYVKPVKQAAEYLEVDINDELKQLENYYNFDTGCIDEIKKKLCKVTQSQAARRSEVDQNRIITDDSWAVSLVRLPDTHNNEHAFVVLEGKTGSKLMIWFADLVANDTLDLIRPGMRDGKVRMDYFESEGAVGSSAELLFRCTQKMLKIRKRDRLIQQTWLIPRPTAEKLIQNIKAQQNNPPKYNVLGDGELAASSATSSGNPIGHNCFTFARVMLLNVEDECIKIPQDNLDKWIGSLPSRFLVNGQKNNEGSDTLLFGLFTFMAGAVMVYSFLKL